MSGALGLARPQRLRVVVPAHQEEALLPGCLAALDVAIDDARTIWPTLDARVVVVADACTDATASAARSWSGVEVVAVDRRCVGAARAAGVRAALAGGHPSTTWVATTDADTRVNPGWVTSQVRAPLLGFDVLVGTVEPDSRIDLPHQGLPPELGAPPAEPWSQAWWARHVLAEGHGHVHGANLGVLGSAYLAVGGFRDLVVGEDRDLVARLDGAGFPVLRTDACRVRTSARTSGRAPHGFAAYLAALTPPA